MKIFGLFITTIFVIIITGLCLLNLDPGIKPNLNTSYIAIMSFLITLTFILFTLFLASLFKLKNDKYHFTRAIVIGTLCGGIFFLKTLALLTLPIFIIVVIIYILTEITLFEFSKNK